MRNGDSGFSPYILFPILIQAFYLIIPAQGQAITTYKGTFSMEDTKVVTPEKSSNLFQGAINLDIKPPTKKQINTRLNAKLNFTDSDKGQLWSWDAAPFGNLGADFSGESYTFNVQQSNYATLNATAELVETEISRAAFSLAPPDLPRLFADYTTTTTATSGKTASESRSDTYSLFGDYRYEWMNFRGGYSTQDRFSQGDKMFTSDAIFFGTGGSYEIMPRTTLSGNVDFNHGINQSARGGQSTSSGRALGLNINSSPVEWLGLTGNFRGDVNEFGSDTAAATSTATQQMDVTGRITPFRPLQFSATLGNRTFDDVERTRSVDYGTVAATFSDRLRDEIQVGLNISRTTESDPEQGDNIRDSLGFNSIMDLTPRISVRANVNIGRSENPGFVSTMVPFASGLPLDRDTYNNKPAGFIFIDTLNRLIYTLVTPGAAAVWSAGVPYDLLPEQFKVAEKTEQFTVSKTLQLNMIPTDKTGLTFSFSSNSTVEQLDVGELGNLSLNSSFNYRPNLRTSYSVTGSASIPQTGIENYSTTMGMSYRFFRGHQMNFSYGRTFSPLRETDNFSGGLKFTLLKRTSLDLTYGTTQLFRDEQTHLIRARWSKSF